MTPTEYQKVIDEFDRLIVDSRELMRRFEATGMDGIYETDYFQVHAIYAKAVSDQRAYTLAMLDAEKDENQASVFTEAL